MSDPHDTEPVDQATIDCWRTNYGLDKRTPSEAAAWWHDNCGGLAPSGSVAALGVALYEIERQSTNAAILAQQVADLTAERDALRADAERLDWIECRAMNGEIQIARSIMGKGYEVAVIERAGGPVTVRVHLGTLRVAIDAARGTP